MMRTLLISTFAFVAAAVPTAAQDKTKPNALTPKEIADGWILLFDGETTFGWTGDNGLPRVEEKALKIGGKHRTVARQITSHLFPAFELSCELMVDYQGLKKKDKGAGGFLLEFANGTSVERVVGPPKEGKPPVWQKRLLRADGGRCLWEDGGTDDGMGLVGVNWGADADTLLMLRDVRFRPTKTSPLFNGKDLTGWKTFPGKKSQFTVEDGAIICRNGPGDLQTEGKYANFVLQLECKSNGKHLNSGVFFRCKANEYQNGYEAQIHNNFTADPPKEYTVEEFDPKTHEPTGKKKLKSAATDYGTGAIYRRVPARSGVAKDGEWFTMTVVAHGNHIATWVNGIQQVDWYDNRPASDNPRTGCRLEAGHISIQGHDPTTDLSFRNIRIAELPAASK